jgi:hypothetical protein
MRQPNYQLSIVNSQLKNIKKTTKITLFNIFALPL